MVALHGEHGLHDLEEHLLAHEAQVRGGTREGRLQHRVSRRIKAVAVCIKSAHRTACERSRPRVFEAGEADLVLVGAPHAATHDDVEAGQSLAIGLHDDLQSR